jgi:hypothetical protein
MLPMSNAVDAKITSFRRGGALANHDGRNNPRILAFLLFRGGGVSRGSESERKEVGSNC